ncbi:hypothetical protein [Salibacterium aidingense]|uniref:hypothetical protein n=1 Tax=Salibacterium aidingense TaxID=384933 RepID=UPI00040D4552|nr:hypothetical protein [Salibacterium aidingense]
MKSLYMGALLFCVVLILTFSILRYVVKAGDGVTVVCAIIAAFSVEWWYRRRQS